MRGEVMSKN